MEIAFILENRSPGTCPEVSVDSGISALKGDLECGQCLLVRSLENILANRISVALRDYCQKT